MSILKRTARLRSPEFYAGILSALLAACTLIPETQLSDASTTGLAAMALLISSIHAERALIGDGPPAGSDLSVGAVLGFPLGFFFAQTSYAHRVGNVDLSRGAERLVLFVFLVTVLVSFLRNRRQTR